MSRKVAIIDGVRTPLCKAGGALASYHADDLGAIVVRELVARTGIDPACVDEVIFGAVAHPAEAMNLARVIAGKAGLPKEVIAQTVQRNCASGMQSLTTAALQIQAGRSDMIIAGGTESMSNIPLMYGREMTDLFIGLMRAKTAWQRMRTLSRFRPRFLTPVVGLQLGLTDPVCEMNMGETAELLAREFGISREEQDSYAVVSHERAREAQRSGALASEILPVCPPPKHKAQESDDGPREGQSVEGLARFKPYFDRNAGTVTIANSCPITDGAVALLLCADDVAEKLGLEPLGFIDAWEYAALDHERMGLGPAYATAKLLEAQGWDLDVFDLIELNEAFAAQVLANERAFRSDEFARDKLGRSKALGEIGRERLNVNGGAIALGHPVGATGSRLVLTVLKELRRRNARRGLATLCVGGGQGAAVALEAA